MPDKPVTHAYDHRPGGFDPTVTGYWHYVSSAAAAWSSSTNYNVGNEVNVGVFNYIAILANGPGVVDRHNNTIGPYQPGITFGWARYWIISAPIFQNGWGNISPGTIPNPVPMGFRLSVGQLNKLDRNTGAIIWYGDHQVEIAGDVAGGSSGTAVFTLPPAYRLNYDVPFPAHDSSMNYVACRLYATGEFVRGIA